MAGHKQLLFLMSLVCLLTLPVAPILAQQKSTNTEAKKLGKKGIYGRNTMDAAEETPAGPDEEKPETEEDKKLKGKYPLSITGHTSANQKAHNLILKGIQSYNLTKKIFDGVLEIKSEYDTEKMILKVEQPSEITVRLEPRDILQYGVEQAYVGVRIRALQQAQKEINSALSSFTQARGLAPYNGHVQEWIRISQDTRKVIAYHIRFYQVGLKALPHGITSDQMEELAQRWNRGVPPEIQPGMTLTTRLRVPPALSNAKKSTDQETVDFTTMKEQLPSLSFEVKKL